MMPSPARLAARCLLILSLALSLLGGPAWADGGKPLTILHFNDLHGQLEPVTDRASGKSLGGVARLAGAVRAVRAHLGVAEDRRLAREVPGVDLVVGGHNHHLYPAPVVENMEGKVATGRLISDVVLEAFRDRGEVSAALDGRITRLPAGANPPR